MSALNNTPPSPAPQPPQTGEGPPTMPQPGAQDFDQRMRVYEAWQRDEDREARRLQTDALRANEAASRELIRLAANIPGTPGSERRELALRILMQQPHVTGLTELQAVDCAIRLADAVLVRFPAAQG